MRGLRGRPMTTALALRLVVVAALAAAALALVARALRALRVNWRRERLTPAAGTSCTYGPCPNKALGARKPCVGPRRLACCNTQFLECELIPAAAPGDVAAANAVAGSDDEEDDAGPDAGPAAAEAAQPDGAPVVGPLPAWARQGEMRWPEKYARNLRAVTEPGAQFDLLLYGDSITMFLGDNPGVWSAKFGDLKAAALGIGANTVEQLAFRIIGRGERPKLAPRVIALLIGINNVAQGSIEPAIPHLEELIRWLQAAYPSTQIVLLAMMRTARFPTDGYNARYAAMARRLGVTYSTCGQGLDPNNRTHMSDGVHPTAAGHAKWLTCLRAAVDAML